MKHFIYHRLMNARLLAFFTFIVYFLPPLGGQGRLYAQLTLGSGVVNSYQAVASVSGATITLSGASSGAAHTLASGDRVLLVQMTGSTAANGGKFEFGTVASASGSTITLTAPTTRAYSPSTEKVQLVWVPYNAVGITVPAGGIVAKKWDGTTGGIVAVQTPGTLTLNGTINADGAGFRYADGTNTINGNDIYNGGGGGGSFGGGGGGGGGYGAPGKAASKNYATPNNLNAFDIAPTDGNLNGGDGGMGAWYTTSAQNAAMAQLGGGGGGAGVGGAGAGGAAGPHGGSGGGGAGYAGGGSGGTSSENNVSGGKGSVGNAGDTNGNIATPYGGSVYSATGGGGNRYVGGGGGSMDNFSNPNIIGKSGTNGGAGGIGINKVGVEYIPTSGGNGGGSTPATFNQYQFCDATFFCPDTRIWMAGGGQLTVQGGGIVMVSAANIVANNKTISANGDNGISRISSTIAGYYAAGGTGGGGGGLLVINTQSISAGPLTLCAKGGQGGKGTSDREHGGGGGGAGGGGLVWVQDPLGGIGNNSSGAPPAVANMTFCVDGGAMAVLTSNPKSANYTGVGGAGGSGSVQVNNNCGVFGTCPVAVASLGDYVWLDTNQNGQQDATETGVASVTAVLYDAVSGTVVSTTLTDGTGHYLFTNLNPGSYYVKFTAPSGTTFTTPNSGNDATDSDVASLTGTMGSTGVYSLTAGEQNLTVDAGLIPLKACLGDYVWLDTNQNGQQDAGETGVASVTAVLYDAVSGTVVSTTLTDGTGHYQFCNLNPGSYYVKFTAPAGTTFTTPNSGNDATDSDVASTTGTMGTTPVVSLTAGENNLTVDAGLIPLKASLGDYVWLDNNQNGQQDGTETGVASVTAVLYDAVSGTVVSTTVTDGTGKYLFTNLNPGSYYVKFTAPVGTTFTTPNSGNDATDSDVASLTGTMGSTGVYSLTAGEQNLTVDAGLIPLKASLGDFVWFDTNKNGQQDAGETGVTSVTVTLYDATTNTPLSTTVTDATGHYLFSNLNPGSYYVVFTVPAGSIFTTANTGPDGTDSDAGVGGKTGVYTLVAGQQDLTVDAGLVSPPCSTPNCTNLSTVK